MEFPYRLRSNLIFQELLFQSPTTYTTTGTSITPLGEQQCYNLGVMLRNTYATNTSSTYIAGLSDIDLDPTKFNSTADGGGEGGVIFDSALALWQGFYPPNPSVETITLSNGSLVTSPLGGYQSIQIQAVLPQNDISLEGFTNCPNWSNRTSRVYNGPTFKQVEQENQQFLKDLASSGLVGDRNTSLSNAYNFYDYMQVNYVHNATYKALVDNSPGTFARVRDLANYHEQRLFTSSNLNSIGQVAGKTLLPRMVEAMKDIASGGSGVRIGHFQLAYKPFLSIFNMTNLAASGFEGANDIVNYASLATYEIRQNLTGNGFDGESFLSISQP